MGRRGRYNTVALYLEDRWCRRPPHLFNDGCSSLMQMASSELIVQKCAPHRHQKTVPFSLRCSQTVESSPVEFGLLSQAIVKRVLVSPMYRSVLCWAIVQVFASPTTLHIPIYFTRSISRIFTQHHISVFKSTNTLNQKRIDPEDQTQGAIYQPRMAHSLVVSCFLFPMYRSLYSLPHHIY